MTKLGRKDPEECQESLVRVFNRLKIQINIKLIMICFAQGPGYVVGVVVYVFHMCSGSKIVFPYIDMTNL